MYGRPYNEVLSSPRFPFELYFERYKFNAALAGFDEGIVPLCLTILILYGDFLLEEQILVKNDSAPSYVHRPGCSSSGCSTR